MRALAFILLSLSLLTRAYSVDLVWPTPNAAFQRGLEATDFIQPSSSGTIQSGLFGCVRNNGSKFHEGIDLFPLQRDHSGEATDQIYSVLPGRVAYVNATPEKSSYGRYIVVEHDSMQPAFYTLYAHLSSVAKGVRTGVRVQSGSVIGVMGRSAGGYSIPNSRAHLHFEIGFRLTDQFQKWYDQKGFKEPNYHGNFNGMNLVGLDPLNFYQAMRTAQVNGMADYLKSLPNRLHVRVFCRQTPDFIVRYPELLSGPKRTGDIIAWDITFTAYGLPKKWTPRFASEGLSGKSGDVLILGYQDGIMEKHSCKPLLVPGYSGPKLSKGTLEDLKKLFAFL